jgi:voltage-dependent calcium channel L type alpha-1D
MLGSIPGVPSFSVLRSFRVLRPLRTLTRLPSVRKVATTLIESMSDLANVGMLLLFMLAIFALFGVSFWRGLFHMRCRLTPFPVKMPDSDCAMAAEQCWRQFLLDAVSDPAAHRCLPYPNDGQSWTQSTSPWLSSGRQDCIWPIDETDLRVCSASTGHTCSKSATFMGKIISRTCGSNYDLFGNPRFIDSLKPYGLPRMSDATFNEAFDWGFTKFDDFAASFVTVFQIVTLEGWGYIMMRVMDVWPQAPSIAVFSLMSVMGGIIALNLFLAVISTTLDKIEHKLSEEKIVESVKISTTTKNPAGSSAFRGTLMEIVGGRVYPRCVIGVIFLNTIILSCDHYGISPVFDMYLDAASIITATAFLIDMVLLNICYGARAYWR